MKKSLEIKSSEFKGPINLPLTINSGQTSQPPWAEVDDGFQELVLFDGKPCLIKVLCTRDDVESSLMVDVISTGDLDTNKTKLQLKEIFGLNDDLIKLYKFLEDDPCLAPSIDFCKGLRLFKASNPFECIISSITSANNSIIRWNRSIRQMKEKWGFKYSLNNGDYFLFPSPSKILSVPEKDLEEMELCGGEKDLENCVNNLISCGVGYRSSYIREAARMVKNDMELEKFFTIEYDDAFQELQQIPGVGPKVADCILLYGFNRQEAFPVDVWIKRIISKLYFDGKDVPVPKIRSFGMEEFGDYAGYVQLYLFHYARKSGLMKSLK